MLETRAGLPETAGRRTSGYTLELVDKKVNIPLSMFLECSQVPIDRTEIPTPNANMLLLLSRDVLQLHNVRQQISCPGSASFTQRLDLGWVVIGMSRRRSQTTGGEQLQHSYPRVCSGKPPPAMQQPDQSERSVQSSTWTSTPSNNNRIQLNDALWRPPESDRLHSYSSWQQTCTIRWRSGQLKKLDNTFTSLVAETTATSYSYSKWGCQVILYCVNTETQWDVICKS